GGRAEQHAVQGMHGSERLEMKWKRNGVRLDLGFTKSSLTPFPISSVGYGFMSVHRVFGSVAPLGFQSVLFVSACAGTSTTSVPYRPPWRYGPVGNTVSAPRPY